MELGRRPASSGFEFDGTHFYIGGFDPASTRRTRNIRAGNAKVALVIDDLASVSPWSQIPVTARQLHGAEREAAWQSITTAAPRFAQYQAKTDREIPVIRLTPRAS